ncbi:hypothetical protein M514_09242 [Trichuris suis]|uniref:Uncharacterized protein n=1 Tax=Trichuris suis TaxID=68888 RepID=A0A085NLD7_9BILA|nr:hypothetical protein M513_09242 [Trichuris suis]KFD70283.1 hypothetical protein M514_09242 [Trichuris suis]
MDREHLIIRKRSRICIVGAVRTPLQWASELVAKGFTRTNDYKVKKEKIGCLPAMIHSNCVASLSLASNWRSSSVFAERIAQRIVSSYKSRIVLIYIMLNACRIQLDEDKGPATGQPQFARPKSQHSAKHRFLSDIQVQFT